MKGQLSYLTELKSHLFKLFLWLKPLTDEEGGEGDGGEGGGGSEVNSLQRVLENSTYYSPTIQAPTETASLA